MSRPPLEVADLVRTAGEAFIERSRQWIRWKHVKVLRAIAACRTAVLGGHVDQCTRCGHRAISYNSCRNRHCPKCQAGALAGQTPPGVASDALRACGVHPALPVGTLSPAKQEDHLQPAVPCQCRN